MRGIGNAYCLADNGVGSLPVVGGITISCYPKEAYFHQEMEQRSISWTSAWAFGNLAS